MQQVPQLRVFLASPGDVTEERSIALGVLDLLEYDPLFRRDGAGGVAIHAIAWDKPGADTAMRITKTPQTAIKEGLPRPSECDIVIVFFWGRMGTPLPYPEYQKEDGSPYLSGTEWEFWDAFNSERATGKPITLVFRRTQDPPLNLKDRKQIDQYHTLLDFFEQFRDPESGALLAGINDYTSPDDLRQKLHHYLRLIVNEIINNDISLITHSQTSSRGLERPLVEAPVLWEGSPFPGLRSFSETDAPIFHGRGREISELVRRVQDSRFVGVVAASGSGKSSLIAAGLIPRLKANAVVSGRTGSEHWRYIRFTPGQADDPLAAMFSGLRDAFPEHVVSPYMVAQDKRAFVESVTTDPNALIEICDALLKEANAPEWTEIFLFIDQFEELFTIVPESQRGLLVSALEVIQSSTRLRCIMTMRSDFYANCLELPALASLLKDGTYPLAVPTAGALVEMIKRPAERAGLTWDEGLPELIQAETGTQAGALALMAYALDELYTVSISQTNRHLTFNSYQAIGGVTGAIGKRAESVFSQLAMPEKERLLEHVFRELVIVDERGTATRQRAALDKFSSEEHALIQAFVNARLLVTEAQTVEVAHEAIFRNWERLAAWITDAQDDLILLRQVRAAANEWDRHEQAEFLLWPAERLRLVYQMIKRQCPLLSEAERNFIEPEQERLYREIDHIDTTHQRRFDIGERLARIGDTRKGIGLRDDGLPDITWLPITLSGEFEIDSYRFIVRPFHIGKYLITHQQFEAFVNSNDFNNPLWWRGFPPSYQFQVIDSARNVNSNAPRDTVSWYQSVAFTRWLNSRFHGLEVLHPSYSNPLIVDVDAEIRLPTEAEWQWAAQNGSDVRAYPWGNWDEYPRANTTEAGINDRSTAVGMYPHGAAACGALDMAGNLYEWCLNDYQNPKIIDGYSSGELKTLRGGSLYYDRSDCLSTSRSKDEPESAAGDVNDLGFINGLRLVLSATDSSPSTGMLVNQ